MITPANSSRHPRLRNEPQLPISLELKRAVTYMGPGTGCSYPVSRVVSHVLWYRYFSCFWQCDQHHRIRYRFSSRRRSPPYVTATGSSSSNVGGAAASASVGSGTRSAAAGMGSGPVVPFTGDAVKAAGSAGGGYLRFCLGRRGCCGMGISSSVWIGKQGKRLWTLAYIYITYTQDRRLCELDELRNCHFSVSRYENEASTRLNPLEEEH